VQATTQPHLFDLPIIRVSEEDILGALFVYCPTQEKIEDSVLKLQTWVLNYAEEKVAILRDIEQISDEEVEAIKNKICVISPLTLALYINWVQNRLDKNTLSSERERRFLKKMPDRFKARYKGNAACRQARELTEEELDQTKGDYTGEDEEDKVKFQRMTFLEFLKVFGEIVKEKMGKGEKS
jgi:hypothetical protein